MDLDISFCSPMLPTRHVACLCVSLTGFVFWRRLLVN